MERTDGILDDASFPMVKQVAQYFSDSDKFTSTELVLVWTGMNDILILLEYYALGEDKMSSILWVVEAAVVLCKTVLLMLERGARHVVVIGSSLQSLSTSQESLTSTLLTQIFNCIIRNVLSSSENILFIDPTLYSPIGHFVDLTTPACNVSKINRYFGTALTYGWSVGCNVNEPYADLVSGANVTTWLLADDIHPTTGGHAFIAGIVWGEMRKRRWVV